MVAIKRGEVYIANTDGSNYHKYQLYGGSSEFYRDFKNLAFTSPSTIRFYVSLSRHDDYLTLKDIPLGSRGEYKLKFDERNCLVSVHKYQ